MHLSVSWLQSLEKRLYSLKKSSANQSFNLFLTCDISCEKVPVNLIRLSQVQVMEPPPGLKSAIGTCIASIPQQVLVKSPVERSKLFFVISWVHSVIVERLRYPRMGWSKPYELNDSDFESALSIADSWMDLAVEKQSRTNISPEKIPWPAIRNLLLTYVYGAKMDNEYDSAILSSLIDHLLRPELFSSSFKIIPESVEVSSGLIGPDFNQMEKIVEWIEHSLPKSEPPSWLGLPNAAESILIMDEGKMLLSKVHKIMVQDNEHKDAQKETANEMMEFESQGVKAGVSSWMTKVKSFCESWTRSIRDIKFVDINPPFLAEASSISPLKRFFAREWKEAKSLLSIVGKDLEMILSVLDGKEKPTNHSRSLMQILRRGGIPEKWRQSFKIPQSFNCHQWVDNFQKRLNHFRLISDMKDSTTLDGRRIWLGGLFHPEGFLTATRQVTAKSLGISLESLYLDVNVVGEKDGISGSGRQFVITGMYAHNYFVL